MKQFIKYNLTALQTALQAQDVQAIIIPTSDPHMSEYLPEHWQVRTWLSGFTGSAGTLVVMADFVGLWTDSRYWIQAQKELLDTPISLQRLGVDKDVGEYLADALPCGVSVVIDGVIVSIAQADKLTQSLNDKGIRLLYQHDILDKLYQLWQDRPPLPKADIVAHDEAFTPVSATEKLTQVRAKLHEQGASAHLIASLDDIAWLTNLRGADVAFNPVFLAYLWIEQGEGIEQDRAILFVDKDKLTPATKSALALAKIDVQEYHDLSDFLHTATGTVLLDPQRVSQSVLLALANCQIIKATNPSTLLKAIKHPQEITHIKQAMIQDGVALCEFFATLEDKLAQGKTLSECDVDTMLIQARSRQAHYVSPSFDTIAGFGANGAIVHYRASETDCALLQGDGLLLVDSGGQYKNGTTDITRMVGVGKVSHAQKCDVTYVLKAHIALARAVFAVGVGASQLDVLARVKLWEQGRDYGHGTGHGVGYFLNVHEGPQSISYHAPNTPERIMQVGMLTSNEPGLYRMGEYGIRLENLIVCVPCENNEFGEFLKFETLTLCPFDTRLLVPTLLDEQEKIWLNDYHARVQEALLPLVPVQAKEWLLARTQAI